MKKIEPSLDRVRRGIIKMSEFTSPEESGFTRISFSLRDKQARKHILRDVLLDIFCPDANELPKWIDNLSSHYEIFITNIKKFCVGSLIEEVEK